MKRTSLTSAKDKGHVTTRTASTRGNDKTTPVRAVKMTSTRQASQSLSVSSRKATSSVTRAAATVRSQSASPAKSRALLKRHHLKSPKSSDSPDEKRQKLGPGAVRGRSRKLATPQTSSPAKREKKRLAEMRKLMTTDGFWASISPASERVNSQNQRRASSSKRPSRTTTPEGLPAKKSVNVSALPTKSTLQSKSSKPEKDQLDKTEKEKELSGSGSTNELRRLKTTEGFWSPSNILSDSRDASPASTSSVERNFRHRSQQQKKSSSEAVATQPAGSQQENDTTRIKQNEVTATPVRSSSAPEKLTAGQPIGRPRNSRAKFLSNSLKKKCLLRRSPTRFGKARGKLAARRIVVTRINSEQGSDVKTNITPPASQQQSEDLKRSLRKRKGEEEDGKLVLDNKTSHDLRKRQPVTPKVKPEEQVTSKPVQSKIKEETREHTRRSGSTRSSPASSLERKSKKTEGEQEKITSEPRRTRLKTAVSEVSKQETEMDSNSKASSGALAGSDSPMTVAALTPQQNAPSKLAISDLLGSGELKRLGTTPGFWAPTPDVSHVLGLSNSRRSPVSSRRLSRRSLVSKGQLSPKKPESSLLQLRKKKLSVLQKQRQLKQQTNKEEQQHQAELALASDTEMKKPKRERFVFGRKKKKYYKTYVKDKTPPDANSVLLDVSSDEECSELNGLSVKGVAQHDNEMATVLEEISHSSKLETHVTSGSSKPLAGAFHSISKLDTGTFDNVESGKEKSGRSAILGISTKDENVEDAMSTLNKHLSPQGSIEASEVSSDQVKPSKNTPVTDSETSDMDTVTEIKTTDNDREKDSSFVANEAKQSSTLVEPGKVEEVEKILPDPQASDVSPVAEEVKQDVVTERKDTSAGINGVEVKSSKESIKTSSTLELDIDSKTSETKLEKTAFEESKQEAEISKQEVEKEEAQIPEKEVDLTKIESATTELEEKDSLAVSSPIEIQLQVPESSLAKEDNNANVPTKATDSSVVKVDSDTSLDTSMKDLDSDFSVVKRTVEIKVSTAEMEGLEIKSVETVKENEVELESSVSPEDSKTEEKPSDSMEETNIEQCLKEEMEKEKACSIKDKKPEIKPEDVVTCNQPEWSGDTVNEEVVEKNAAESVAKEGMEVEEKAKDETSPDITEASVNLMTPDQSTLSSDEDKSSQVDNDKTLPNSTDSTTCAQPASPHSNNQLENEDTVTGKQEESSEIICEDEPGEKPQTLPASEASVEVNPVSSNPSANKTCSGESEITGTGTTCFSSGLSHSSLQTAVTETDQVTASNQTQAQEIISSNDTTALEDVHNKPALTTSEPQTCPATASCSEESEKAEVTQSTIAMPGVLKKSKQDPLRKVYKKRRNAWKRGILQKATKMYKKSAQSKQSVLPQLASSEQAVPSESVNDDGEIVPLEDRSLVTHSQNLTNTIRDAKKSAKELRKSLILRRLQTDANLAGGSIDNSELLSSSRNLREIAPKIKTMPALQKEIASDVNVIDSTVKLKIQSKRSPGRPRKHKRKLGNGLPKLVLSTQPGKNVRHKWYKTPPRLSPQPIASKTLETTKNTTEHASGNQDPELVSESVDESDIHLYLSGVSDEEPSPAKSTEGSDLRDMYEPLNFTHTLAVGSAAEHKESQSATSLSRPIVKNKVKGRKGKPPGTPMTEEEKNKVKTSLQARFDDYANFKMPRTARKSAFTPSLYLAPNVSQFSPKKFSLRKKTTRSPLEMLEMKRKQEEAIYDMEEEKRLAKRINRLEKRYSQASADESFEDEYEDWDWEIKDCAVILNDFVKKLHLENIDLPSAEDSQIQEERKYESGEDGNSAVDEDWCADLEDFQDDTDVEWTGDGEQREKRPFIPRLKLKRVTKVGKEKKAKGHKSKKRPKFVCPQQDAQQPLKLVIKTEVPTSTAPEKVARTGPAIDVSSIQRKGFEGSFVDFLQGKTTDEFMDVNPKRSSYRSFIENYWKEKSHVNEGHLIMNLGDVGGLKPNSPPKQKPSPVVGSAATSGQMSAANDDMGAMRSSYTSSQTAETKGGGKQTNQLTTATTAHPEAISTKETLVSAAPKDNQDSPIVTASPKQAGGKTASAICSSTGLQKEKESGKSLESSVATNNNNNVDVPSPKVPQQTQVSAASDSSAPLKASPEPVAKRPTTSALPEGWKVKVIQLPDKQCSSGKRLKCKRCSFNTLSQLTMESHIYSHIPGVQFRCAYCESEFSSMAATASHIKNTHQMGEARLHISRHVDEHNFYDVEDSPPSDEQQQATNERAVGSPRGGTQVAGSVVVAGGDGLVQGGQSPPVVISVLVSSGAAAGGGNHGTAGVIVRPANAAPGLATPTSNRRRYVCTHCGFSTNVHADAEHHVSDLHPSSSIFACTLCKENTYYSDSEIKQHAASVHPSRTRPYRRLPDFYDAEKLNTTSTGCEDCLGELGGSVFPEGHAAEDSSPVDHRRRAKDYLQLQEGLKEKRSAEADSTTAVDYMECEEQQEDEGPAESAISSQTHAEAESSPRDGETSSSRQGAGQLASKDDELHSDTSDISSSAICSSQPEGDRLTTEDKSTANTAERVDDPTPDTRAVEKRTTTDVEGSSSDSLGLKIVEVVSISNDNTQECQESANSSVVSRVEEETPSRLSTVAATPSPAPSTGSTSSSSITTTTAATSSSSAPPPVSQPATGGQATASTSSQPGGGLPLSYKCSACRVHTPYLLMMVKHLKAKHPHMGCFSCPYCKLSAPPQPTGDSPSAAGQPESFVTQKQLRSHIRRLHPDKTGRNEIALSAKAKQFVEAMVLPASTECIRVGNRLVLEEDIHTCTYCNLKMTSLASVYEHLNEVHSDLFEFVCPICQTFKSKDLEAISVHSLEFHLSEVETDKVHVSVPKNLFSVLKCISKGGKYIEKQLDGSDASSSSKSSTPTPSATSAKDQAAGTTSSTTAVATTPSAEESSNAPLDLTSASKGVTRSPGPAHSPAVAHTALKSPTRAQGLAGFDAVKPAQLNFSSALFDTSSLSVPPQLAVSALTGTSGAPVPVAAASSFLSPSPGKSQQAMSAAGKHRSKSNKSPTPASAKALPVLNVPTIKPRPQPSSSVGARPRSGNASEPLRTSSQPAINMAARIPVISHTSSLATASTSQHPQSTSINLQATASSLDDLPDDEPTPDAFKIFNLQPTSPLVNSPVSLGILHSPSPSSLSNIPSSSPAIPTVFPPVSSQLNSGFIQGPIVGFPAGMVISPALLPPHATFSQQQQALFHSAGPAHAMLAGTSTSSANNTLNTDRRFGSSSSSPSFTPPQRPKSTSASSANTHFLKEQQKRELFLLKQQHQQQKQASGGRPLLPDLQRLQAKEKQKQLRMKQLQAMQQACQQQQQFAHQQQMIQRAVLTQQQHVRMLAQQAQSQSRPFPSFSVSPQTWVPSQPQQQQQQQQQSQQETLPPNTNDFPSPAQTRPFSLAASSSSSVSTSASPSAAGCISPVRPNKGVHKRSSSLYQCPYCPTPVTLKALDVASHIHQKHPGSQVVFKKATP